MKIQEKFWHGQEGNSTERNGKKQLTTSRYDSCCILRLNSGDFENWTFYVKIPKIIIRISHVNFSLNMTHLRIYPAYDVPKRLFRKNAKIISRVNFGIFSEFILLMFFAKIVDYELKSLEIQFSPVQILEIQPV